MSRRKQSRPLQHEATSEDNKSAVHPTTLVNDAGEHHLFLSSSGKWTFLFYLSFAFALTASNEHSRTLAFFI